MYPNLILGFPVFFELIHVNFFMKSIAIGGKFSFFVKLRENKNKLQIPLGIPFDRALFSTAFLKLFKINEK